MHWQTRASLANGGPEADNRTGAFKFGTASGTGLASGWAATASGTGSLPLAVSGWPTSSSSSTAGAHRVTGTSTGPGSADDTGTGKLLPGC